MQSQPLDYSLRSMKLKLARLTSDTYFVSSINVIQEPMPLTICREMQPSAEGSIDPLTNYSNNGVPLMAIKQEAPDDFDHAIAQEILPKSQPLQLDQRTAVGISTSEVQLNPSRDLEKGNKRCKFKKVGNGKKRSRTPNSPIVRVHDKNENDRKALHIHRGEEIEIKPEDLVATLATYHNFSADFLCLLADRHYTPARVVEVAERHQETFQLQEETVRLEPRIKICKAYRDPKGCLHRKTCTDLHICKNYAVGECTYADCVWGHNWDTGHNISALKVYFLHGLPLHALQMLFRDSRRMSSVEDFIDICASYNGHGCDAHNCIALHICLSYFVSIIKGNLSQCSQTCPLNHDLLSPSCVSLLEMCGISPNESIKDIAQELFAMWRDKQSISLSLKNITPINDLEKTHGTSQTIWSHDLSGEVPIAEICYFSVENSCHSEDIGCQRLHASKHYHWQAREGEGPWLNLRSNQVQCLELAYCDPSKSTVTLPRLDPSSLDHSARGLINLMGRDSWVSDFKLMIISNSSFTKALSIRRLCTQKHEGVHIYSSEFAWYFQDGGGEWTEYGKSDSSGNSNLTANITSDQIEVAYLNLNQTMQFSNLQFTYEVNFPLMVQTNKMTGKLRPIERRPRLPLQDETVKDLPKTWIVMSPKQRVQRISLTGTSPEYKAVIDLLAQHQNVVCKWMSVERIQNPYLWRAYENKVKEMTILYGGIVAVDIRYLFHGTTPDVVQNICEENFDWRLHGANNGQAFGRGTYFSTDLQLACNYTRADANGYRYLFIANVAVGTKAIGMHTMQRPPKHPVTNLTYDSTVNNLPNPNIIVKYDKQEYYPEYLVIFY